MSMWLGVVGALAALTLAGPGLAIGFVVSLPQDQPDAIPGNAVCDVPGISFPSPPLPAPSTSTCTLRAAVMESNASPGADLIFLDFPMFALSIAGADEDAAATGDLDLLGAVSITTAVGASRSDRLRRSRSSRAPSRPTLRRLRAAACAWWAAAPRPW
jgi:hypothetical protein